MNTRKQSVDMGKPIRKTIIKERPSMIADNGLTTQPDKKVKAVATEEERSEKRVKNARCALSVYLKRIQAPKSLSATEEIELSRKIQNGDEHSRKILIEANLRLVVIAASYYKGKGLEFIDLVQEGNIGLFKATQKFSPARGCRFATYAYWRIREAITRSLSNKSRAVRLPVHVVELITKIHGAKERFNKRLDRDPTPAELAQIIGISTKRIEMALQYDRPCSSLDSSENEDQDRPAGIEVGIIDDSAFERIKHDDFLTGLEKLLKTLSDVQRKIVGLRFGLDNQEPCCLAEVSQKLGLSRNQVGKQSCLAMRKLRKAAKSDKFLLSYLS